MPKVRDLPDRHLTYSGKVSRFRSELRKLWPKITPMHSNITTKVVEINYPGEPPLEHGLSLHLSPQLRYIYFAILS
jgi:hypothetical protein